MRMATLAAGLALVSAPAFAARDPGASGPVSGHVTITAKAADIGIGFTWGTGVTTISP